MGYQIDEVVGRNVKALRLERRLTQAGLAELTGLTKQTISHIESGLGANSKTIERIAESLDTSVFVFYSANLEDTGIELKRVSVKPVRLNTAPYVEKLEKAVDSIFSSAKEIIYYSYVAPTIKSVFAQNHDIIIASVKGNRGEEALSALKENLLETIRQAVFNDLMGDVDDSDELVDPDELDDLVEGGDR